MITPSPLSAPLQDQEGRYELKFLSPVDSYDWVIGKIKRHPGLFHAPYPARSVNNIYFDTENLDAYADNLSGISRRVKVRYRWYGDDDKADKGTLEVKLRRNQTGWKLQYKMPGIQISHGLVWNNVLSDLKKELPPEGIVWLDAYTRPILINRYRRKYFVSADRAFRITVDENVRTYNQWISRRVDLNRPAEKMQDSIIVEVKFAQEHRKRAPEILDALSIRRSRHSKYMTGAEACFTF